MCTNNSCSPQDIVELTIAIFSMLTMLTIIFYLAVKTIDANTRGQN